jgi:hypothetical protein
MKLCRICGIEKPLTDFPKNRVSGRKDGHRTECKECHRQITGEISKLKKKSGETNPGLQAPCKCCGKTGTKKYFDHCHIHKKFRGWLCNECNTGIGKLGDNLDGVMNAVVYLKNQ